MTQQKLKSLIKDFVANYRASQQTRTNWKSPVTAFANANDPLFLELKNIVSPSHALPHDFISDAQTVISFFLPFDNSVVRSNIDKRNCSKEWAVAYLETNRLIHDLNTYIQRYFKEIGFKSTIIPATHNYNPESLMSDWSHRHVAYIAGLGKFGINNMLITEKGCCGRIGSIVTSASIAPSPRDGFEYCLYKFNGSCGKCIDRCVNEALFVNSFERKKCYDMCLQNNNYHSGPEITDVCGKCLVGVPCSLGNPVTASRANTATDQ
jgi:epoxyqueuosine reductase QueG